MSTKREVLRGQKVLKMGKPGTFCELVTITYHFSMQPYYIAVIAVIAAFDNVLVQNFSN